MSEHAPQPSLNQLKAVQMDNGQTRYQDVENGHRFVPESTFIEATKHASQILVDTVTELGDVTREEVATYAKELGLNDDYLKPHQTVPGMKVLDRDRLKGDTFSSEDAENLQHNQRQAEYDELFAGKSDEDIDNEISRNSHQKRVDEHNARNRAENDARGARNAEKAAEVAQHNRIVDRYNALVDERMARREEIINMTGLDKLSYTELGALLGEKPSYKVPKYEYVKRVKALQEELKSSEALPYKEHIQTPNGSIDMTSRSVVNSESTNQTIEAMKLFNKQSLQAQAEKTADSNEATTVPLTKEELLRQSIELGDAFKSLKTAEERSEFIKNHSVELSNQLVLLMSKTEEGRSQLESLSVKEIENLLEPLREYMSTIFRDENGQSLTKSEVENFLGAIYKDAVTERIFGSAAQDNSTPEVDSIPAAVESGSAFDILGFSKQFAELDRDDRLALLTEHKGALRAQLSGLLEAFRDGQNPMEGLEKQEAIELFNVFSAYLKEFQGSSPQQIHKLRSRMVPQDEPRTGKNHSVAHTAPQSATAPIAAEAKQGRLRNWATKKKAATIAAYNDGLTSEQPTLIGNLARKLGKSRAGKPIHRAAQAMARVGGNVAQKRQDARSRRAEQSGGHGAVVAGAALASVAGAEVRGNTPKSVASRPEKSASQSTVEVTKSDAESERLKNRKRGLVITGAALLAGAASLIPLMDGEDAPKRVAPVETVGGVGNLPDSTAPAAAETSTSTEPRTNADRLDDSSAPEQQVAAPFTDEQLRETYTAEVAYRLNPAQAPELTQKGIDIYNFSHGTHFELAPRNGTTQIVDGAHTISPDEMQELNKAMMEYYMSLNGDVVTDLPEAL